VALGAFGDHALRATLSPAELATFETGVRYQMYHAFGLFVVAWAASRWAGAPVHVAGWLFVVGIVLSTSGMIAHAGIATAVWLCHDLIGAGIWQPTQMAIMQHLAKPESRAAEVSKVMALSYLGWVVGPPLAGVLYSRAHGLPFVAGGVFMVISALMLLPLRLTPSRDA